MELYEITDELKAHPGEYIYHEPTRQIVLCGSFNRGNDQIRVLAAGRLFCDEIKNFKKIKLSKEEKKHRTFSRCKGCGK
jgi:hypothetical protein|tara:strand:+ start:539 stop:775 length:237 start_codon:yes stop_codon:yes gene_type:complete